MIHGADDIWCLIAAIGADFHADRVECIAEALSQLTSVKDFERARHAFGANGEKCADNLRAAWSAAPNVSSSDIVVFSANEI